MSGIRRAMFVTLNCRKNQACFLLSTTRGWMKAQGLLPRAAGDLYSTVPGDPLDSSSSPPKCRQGCFSPCLWLLTALFPLFPSSSPRCPAMPCSGALSHTAAPGMMLGTHNPNACLKPVLYFNTEKNSTLLSSLPMGKTAHLTQPPFKLIWVKRHRSTAVLLFIDLMQAEKSLPALHIRFSCITASDLEWLNASSFQSETWCQKRVAGLDQSFLHSAQFKAHQVEIRWQ